MSAMNQSTVIVDCITKLVLWYRLNRSVNRFVSLCKFFPFLRFQSTNLLYLVSSAADWLCLTCVSVDLVDTNCFTITTDHFHPYSMLVECKISPTLTCLLNLHLNLSFHLSLIIYQSDHICCLAVQNMIICKCIFAKATNWIWLSSIDSDWLSDKIFQLI